MSKYGKFIKEIEYADSELPNYLRFDMLLDFH